MSGLYHTRKVYFSCSTSLYECDMQYLGTLANASNKGQSKKSLQYVYLECFIYKSETNTSHLIALLSQEMLNTVPAPVQIFIILWSQQWAIYMDNYVHV